MALSIGELVGYIDLDTSAGEGALSKFTDKLGGMGGTWGKVLGGVGLAAGGLFAGSLSSAMGNEISLDKMSASLGLSKEESKRIGGVAGDLYANAYGESLGDVTEAVGLVIKNIDGMASASEKDLNRVSAKVMDVATAFDQDLGMTTAAVGQMLRTGLAKDADEALDIITKGLQGPANKADDLMETFNEYGTQFRKLGLSGKDAMGLLSQGVQAGARDADIVADSLKEFTLRTQEATTEVVKFTDGSTGLQLSELGMAFENVGVKVLDAKGNLSDAAQTLQSDLARGGEKGRAALDTVLDGLQKIHDPVKRTKTMVTLFGTQAEDMGDALLGLDLDTAGKEIGKVGGAAEKMGKTLNDNASANIEGFKRKAKQAFVNTLGGSVLPAVTDFTGALNEKLAPALEFIGDAFSKVGDFLREHEGLVKVAGGAIASFLIPWIVVAGVQATISAGKQVVAWLLVAATGKSGGKAVQKSAAQVVAGWAIMAAKSMIHAAKVAAAWVLSMGPIAIVIAAVIGLVALIVKNWDKIKSVITKAWNVVKDKTTGAWNSVKDAVVDGATRALDWVRGIPGKIGNALGNLTEKVRGLFRDAMEAGKEKVTGIGQTIIGWIQGIPGKILNKLSDFKQAGKDLLQGFVDGMKNAAGVISGIAGNVWNAVKGLLNGAIGKINAALEFTIKLPGPDLHVDLPNIPQLATGGRATGSTLAVIGEGREPESVLPDSVLRGLLERAHAAGAASAASRGTGRDAPLIGAVYQQQGESTDTLAERLWFKTRTRG